MRGEGEEGRKRRKLTGTESHESLLKEKAHLRFMPYMHCEPLTFGRDMKKNDVIDFIFAEKSF